MTRYWTFLLFTVKFLNPIYCDIEPIPTSNFSLAECLTKLFENDKVDFRKNIRISVETESESSKWNFVDILTKYLAANNNLVFELRTNSIARSPYTIHARVLLADTFDSFRRLLLRQRMNAKDISGTYQFYYVVFKPNGKIENLQLILKKIMDFCLRNFIKHLNVLVEQEPGVVEIYTYYPYNEKICRDNTPILYNYFIDKQLLWKKPTFPGKLDNMRKCALVIVVTEHPPYLTVVDGKPVGFDLIVLQSLADIMNFTINVVIIEEKHDPTDKVLGAILIEHINDGDLAIGGFLCSKDRREHFAGMYYFTSASLNLVIKKPKEYSPLEILLFPFDVYTWMIFLLILIGRGFGQVLWKKFSEIFLSPGKLSSRLHLLSWLLGILIIKSSYEGSLFKFIHKQPQRRVPADFEETMAADYKFLAQKSYYYELDPFFDAIPEKIFYIDVPFMQLFDELDKRDDKFAIFSSSNELIVHKNDPSRYERYYTIKKPVHKSFLCIYMPKFSFLTEEFKKKIKYMSYSGLIKRSYDKLAAESLRKNNVAYIIVAKSMKLHQLMGAFHLLMVLCVISTCLFTFEFLSNKYSILKKFMDHFH